MDQHHISFFGLCKFPTKVLRAPVKEKKKQKTKPNETKNPTSLHWLFLKEQNFSPIGLQPLLDNFQCTYGPVFSPQIFMLPE